MASVNEIYGQIGAAKAFNSSVAYSLDLDTEANEDEIRELEQQIEETTNDKEKKRINKRIKTMRRRNKTNNAQSKIAKGATDFLTKIASYLDIGIAVIIQWIAKIIVMVLPALEISIKMLLLTNIKKMVSCAIDPRIPDEWRYPGVLLNEAMVDPRHILKASPYSKWGRYNYFGTFYDKNYLEPRPTFELARAEDMNAFLWFAKNCAKFVSPNIITNASTYFDVGADATLFNTHEFKGRDAYRYVEGSTFKHSADGNTTFLCEKREQRNDGTYYTIVPATDKWTGVTWYKDRTSIIGKEKSKKINYDKSKPLFNIEYIRGYEPDGIIPEGNFRFRILPKPFSTAGGFIVDLDNNINTLYDKLDVPSSGITELNGNELTNSNIPNYKYPGIQSPLPYVARFNKNGVYDRKGRYSINTNKYYVRQLNNTETELTFGIFNMGDEHQHEVRLVFDKKTKVFKFYDTSTGSYDVPIDKISGIISECYGGNTVYEFNYDYVVSMKLFDEKSIATGVVDALMNINIPNPFKRSSRGGDSGGNGDAITNTDQIIIDNYVDKLVEKMIDTEDREFTDCFYTFSNKGYEAMEKKTADNVINSTMITDQSMDSIQEIYDVIDSYDGDATLNERIETISLAITKAANACGFGDEVTGSGVNNSNSGFDNDGFNYNPSTGNKAGVQTFITQAVQFLMSAIVNAILTPKVLILLQVNRMMMGTYALPTTKDYLKDNYTFSVEDLLNGLSGLLKGVIREIIDTIHKELLRLILEKLSEMMATFMKKLGHEYAMKWVLLLKQLLACFKRNKNRMNGGGYGNRIYGAQYTDVINNVIDQVDYADIDVLIDEIMPNTNPC